MKSKTFTNFLSILLIGLILSAYDSHAQTPWSGSYGNEWLAGKYSQPWVRIGVLAKGIHKVNISDLPQVFKDATKSKLQLWHRGQQVSLIKADASEILFYGVPNDGSSDELLYRLPVSRRNPYYSTYSDESSYFLTVDPSVDGNRAEIPVVTPNAGAVQELFHIKTDIKKYANEYSHSTANYYRPSTFNSYFEEGKQGTGTSLLQDIFGATVHTSNPKPLLYSNSYTATPFSYTVSVPYLNGTKKITIHLKSRRGTSKADLYVGKTAATLRPLGDLSLANLEDYDYTFNLIDSDYNASGIGTLGFKSTRTGIEGSGYSISYFILEYQQNIDMQNLTSYEFFFPAASNGSQSNISVARTPAGVTVYDISNPSTPRIISGSPNALTVDRNGQALKLLITKDAVTVPTTRIQTVNFNALSPSSYNYLIVCSGTLNTSANTYADYRRLHSPGKKYKPVVVNIRDIYNQFNYGEPSPVAIRRFVDYMISDQNKNKFLLLIGKSTTYFERSVRELTDEVPTVGFPGSDLLLVDGLGGTPDDVPAIPVGRISATSNQHVIDYLAKITKYESQTDVSWRKNVIHMNGGKTTDEITQFSGYLSTIGSSVTGSPFSGNIITKIRNNTSTLIQEMTLAPELNGTAANVEGVGMVSYFGHGSVDQTDYNAGYATDTSKKYNNQDKYPVLFYNGCGVNNIFSGRSGLFGSTPASLIRPMSLDWLLAPNKGAIIVFGNTWDAFPYNSNEYLDKLYPHIFSTDDHNRKTIGEILQAVALQTKIEKGYTYNPLQNSRVSAVYDIDRANIHQILLQGDPALRILYTAVPLPVNLVTFEAKSELNRVNISWKTASEKNNSHFVVERSYNSKVFEEIGRVEGKGETDVESNYSLYDINPLPGISYYRLKQVDMETVVDGKIVAGVSTYSKIIAINRDASDLMVISPNPSADFVNVTLNIPSKVVKWNLLDIKGNIRKSGQNSNKIDLSDLQSGEYILEVVTENKDLYTRKLVKR